MRTKLHNIMVHILAPILILFLVQFIFPLCAYSDEARPIQGVTWIKVSPENLSIKTGESLTLTARLVPHEGAIEDVTKTAKFVSMNPNVFTVNGNVITGTGSGYTYLLVSSGGNSSEYPVKVDYQPLPSVPLRSISISPSNIKVTVGEPGNVKVLGIFVDGSVHDITDKVTWYAPMEYGNITPDGRIKAYKAGSFSITAIFSGYGKDIKIENGDKLTATAEVTAVNTPVGSNSALAQTSQSQTTSNKATSRTTNMPKIIDTPKTTVDLLPKNTETKIEAEGKDDYVPKTKSSDNNIEPNQKENTGKQGSRTPYLPYVGVGIAVITAGIIIIKTLVAKNKFATVTKFFSGFNKHIK